MNELTSRPIGILDSGMGGLTVLKPAAQGLPRETFIYYGDSANAPYGTKTPEAIWDCVSAAVQILMESPIKLLLIACNTATSVAAARLRQSLPIPVVAMEPALKPASEMGGQGQIVVLATRATLTLPRFQESLARFGRRAVAVPLFGLVERIEAGDTGSAAIRDILETALAPALAAPTDAIVLGCTHYPFVRPVIEGIAPGVPVVDGTAGTLAQLRRVLESADLLRRTGTGSVVLRSSDPRAVDRMGRLYGGYMPTGAEQPPGTSPGIILPHVDEVLGRQGPLAADVLVTLR